MSILALNHCDWINNGLRSEREVSKIAFRVIFCNIFELISNINYHLLNETLLRFLQLAFNVKAGWSQGGNSIFHLYLSSENRIPIMRHF